MNVQCQFSAILRIFLFIDTVLSLVKTVLNPSVDTTQREEDNAASLASGDGSSLAVNSSGDGKKEIEPCAPEVM